MTIEVNIGAADIAPIETKGGEFALMTIEGFTHSYQIGEPKLPVLNRILSVPSGCELKAEVIESTVKEISLADFKITQPIMPVQPSLSKSQNPDDVPFEYKEDIYHGLFFMIAILFKIG